MNVRTGELSEFAGASEQVVNGTKLTMHDAGRLFHTLLVPNGVESNVMVSVRMYGVEYMLTMAGCLF